MMGTTKLESFNFLITVRLPSSLLLSLPTKPNHLSLAQVYHVTVTVKICVNRMAGRLEGNTLLESMVKVEVC